MPRQPAPPRSSSAKSRPWLSPRPQPAGSFAAPPLPRAPQLPSVHVFTRHTQRTNPRTGKPLCSHHANRDYHNCRCPK